MEDKNTDSELREAGFDYARLSALANDLEKAVEEYGLAEFGDDAAEGSALMSKAMDARDELLVIAGYIQALSHHTKDTVKPS